MVIFGVAEFIFDIPCPHQEEKSVVTCSDEARHNLDNVMEDVYVTFTEVEVRVWLWDHGWSLC